VTWVQNFSDNFNRPVNALYVGNNWTDWTNTSPCVSAGFGSPPAACSQNTSAGMYTIVSNVLSMSGAVSFGNAYRGQMLTRPLNECPTVNCREVITTPAVNTASGIAYGGAQRVQLNGDQYYLQVSLTGANNVQLYTITGPSSATILSQGTASITNGHVLTFDYAVTSSSPTTLTAIITDATTSTTLLTLSTTDSTTELQSPGQMGVEHGNNTTTTITNFVGYSDTSVAQQVSYTVLCVGDSISFGVNTAVVSACQNACNFVAAVIAPLNVYCLNAGYTGSTTANWQPGQADYNQGLTLAQNYGLLNTTLVIFNELGVNDAETANNVSQATYISNQEAINAGLLSALPGSTVIMNCPTYVNYALAGNPYGLNTPTLTSSYCAAMPTIAAAAPTSVFVGDAGAQKAFAGSVSWLYTRTTAVYGSGSGASGLHPNNVGAPLLGFLWALAFLKHIGAVGGYYFLY
jgi:hypothetical protein